MRNVALQHENDDKNRASTLNIESPIEHRYSVPRAGRDSLKVILGCYTFDIFASVGVSACVSLLEALCYVFLGDLRPAHV